MLPPSIQVVVVVFICTNIANITIIITNFIVNGITECYWTY